MRGRGKKGKCQREIYDIKEFLETVLCLNVSDPSQNRQIVFKTVETETVPRIKYRKKPLLFVMYFKFSIPVVVR